MNQATNQETVNDQRLTAIQTMDVPEYLNKYGLPFTSKGDYYFVPAPPTTLPVELYFTVIKTQLAGFLETILPILFASKVPFRIPATIELCNKQSYGLLGVQEIGKVITAYFSSEDIALQFSHQVAHLLQGFKGPAVPDMTQLANYLFGPYNPNTGLAQKQLDKNPKNAFKPIETLKNDVKGLVVKGYLIKGFLNFSTCILKQGKRHMWSDDFGRDMHDRLNWQYQVHQDLKGEVNLPKVYEYRENVDETLLIMQFIKGQPLLYEISDVYRGRAWRSLNSNEKNKLLNLLDEVLNIVSKLHQKGYVHRDLTPMNFIRKGSGALYIVDFEMSYNVKKSFPLPPFSLGTPGYMSPEQISGLKPTFAEDIFALGSLMMTLYTNMPPIKFNQFDAPHLIQQLHWFTGDLIIAQLIASCFHQDPQSRPQVQELQHHVEQFRERLNQQPEKFVLPKKSLRDSSIDIDPIIKASYHSFTAKVMDKEEIMFNVKSTSQSNGLNDESMSLMNGGITRNISGLLFFLATNTQVPAYIATYIKDKLEKFPHRFMPAIDPQKPGLFTGSAGNALTASFALKAGLKAPSIEISDYLVQCFIPSTSVLTLISGIAGQGLALLYTKAYMDKQFVSVKLDEYTQAIVKAQSANGSWPVYSSSKSLTLGLINGQAGIILFLLKHFQDYNENYTKEAAIKGLTFLIKQSVVKKKIRNWPSKSYKSVTTDFGLSNGLTGIALVFLWASEILKDGSYRLIAESILNGLPETPTYGDYSLHSGMAGIGVVLIEMAKVSTDQKWLDKANWIAQVFCYSFQYMDAENGLWNTQETLALDPGIITGYAGIVYFLERLWHLDNLRN